MTEQPPSEGQTPSAAQPAARRGPPIEIAEEVLDERGEHTAGLLAHALGSMATETGGRDDIPWARVGRADLVRAAEACIASPGLAIDMLHCLLAVDYEDRIELEYVLFSIANDRKVLLKVDLPADSPVADSATGLWEAAGWYERETHDLFGVVFEGNPDLSPLLLYEGFEGYPGLRSFPLHDYEEW